jgi:hypothetical protein
MKASEHVFYLPQFSHEKITALAAQPDLSTGGDGLLRSLAELMQHLQALERSLDRLMADDVAFVERELPRALAWLNGIGSVACDRSLQKYVFLKFHRQAKTRRTRSPQFAIACTASAVIWMSSTTTSCSRFR